MPARWIELLLRIDTTLDSADTDLTDSDRQTFYVHAIANATRRQSRRQLFATRLPQPTDRPSNYRDPTGEDDAHVRK